VTTQGELSVIDNSKAIRVDTTKYTHQTYVVARDNRQFRSVSSFIRVGGWLAMKLNNYIGYKFLASSPA
jgi:hypothetical protein